MIFIHGLGGDARTTWTNTATGFVFPEELARDFAEEGKPTYVVAFDYVSRLEGGPSILSIADRLEFEIGELLKRNSYRTLRIVAHSMGGLVAREYILRHQPLVHPQLKVTNVVLLASPSNGSELAELGRFVSGNRQVEELRHIDRGNTYLESLNKDWNRAFKGGGHSRHVLLYAGYEELGMPVLGHIVRLSSAIPYADESMGFQEEHISIAKPKERNVLYRWVKAKLAESLEETALQLLNGMVQQGLLAVSDVSQRMTRTMDLLEGLQALSGTELEKVLTYVKTGQFQSALGLLAETETKESQLIENIAKRRFAQAEIHELLFQMDQAGSYYSQAIQLSPTNGWFRQQYGWFLIITGDTQEAIFQLEEAVQLSRVTHNSILEEAALVALGVGYDNLGQYKKAIEFHKEALAICRRIGNVQGEGSALGNLGISYANLGQYAKAILFFEEALAISRRVGNVQGEGSALGSLGIAYASLDEYAKAIEYFEQVLAISREARDLRGEGSALGNLGNVYFNLGEYSKAIEFHKQTLVIHRKLGDMRGEGTGLRNLGNTFNSLGQYTKAIEFHEQALMIYRQLEDVRGEGSVLGSLGNAYGDLGQYPKAIEYYEQALVIHRKIGNIEGEGCILGGLGVTFGDLGQYAKAIEFHEQALAISRTIGNARDEGNALGNLGTVYGAQGQYAQAIEHFEQALEISRTIGNARAEGDALGNLGFTYFNLGQYPKAVEFLEQALSISRKIGNVRGEGEALGKLGLTYASQGQYSKAIDLLSASKMIFETRLGIAFPLKSNLERVIKKHEC